MPREPEALFQKSTGHAATPPTPPPPYPLLPPPPPPHRPTTLPPPPPPYLLQHPHRPRPPPTAPHPRNGRGAGSALATLLLTGPEVQGPAPHLEPMSSVCSPSAGAQATAQAAALPGDCSLCHPEPAERHLFLAGPHPPAELMLPSIFAKMRPCLLSPGISRESFRLLASAFGLGSVSTNLSTPS
uniref:Uncharacterized protein n=1 Tax=Rousettus aegyptiacus TaxID=9407 RepID=A0A7J8IM48_ROUAE|nr:hypothetical protein HJG63_010804 [Rousettus aegyptiacus]